MNHSCMIIYEELYILYISIYTIYPSETIEIRCIRDLWGQELAINDENFWLTFIFD